ncbi:hypothetical protein GCM10010909_33220 [Acidocella aquatica]|uniref:Uncharacterized protein n=1 Tax=Acidocella aquatica TaxID=1922313 RepID=A0ABQ6AB42_9PROT|nr:hypothetical protein GCM10010909_33220 [Acidocella aquatica]
MGNTDCMTKDRGLSIRIVIYIDPADKLYQLARLGQKMRPLCIDSLAYKVDGHGIISHFRCVLILPKARTVKNYRAPEMRDNSRGRGLALPVSTSRRIWHANLGGYGLRSYINDHKAFMIVNTRLYHAINRH